MATSTWRSYSRGSRASDVLNVSGFLVKEEERERDMHGGGDCGHVILCEEWEELICTGRALVSYLIALGSVRHHEHWT